MSDNTALHEAFKSGAGKSVIANLARERNRARGRTRGKGGAGVYATGIEEVDAALRDMPRSLQATGARKGTRAAAKVALEMAISLAPHLTGALEKSLKVRAMKRSRRADRRWDVGHTIITGDEFFTGEQFYAGFVEFGTKPRQTKQGADRGSIPKGQFAFLRPSIYTDQARKFQAYVAEVQAWLRGIGRASTVAQTLPD